MRVILFLFLLGVPNFIFGQNQQVTIRQIVVEGNKKTRRDVILREMNFAPGDTVLKGRLSAKIKENELLLLNTGLFTSVKIFFKNWIGATDEIDLQITVKENWYIYPIPIFELADRNFNVWWVEQNRSLARTNYGVAFAHTNLTGRRDKFEIVSKFGYTRNFSLKYDLPYLTANKKIGAIFDIAYFQNKEVNYLTDGNKQVFFNQDDRFVYQRFRLKTGLSFRPKIRALHELELRYHQNKLMEVIAEELNPDFFLEGRDFQRFFSLTYKYSFDFRDRRYYPLNGFYFSGEIEKAGLGIMGDRNALEINLRYDKYISINSKFSLALQQKAKFSLIRNQQPYNDNRALGFNSNSLRGYELYIVDGLDMGIFKTSLRFELLNKAVTFGKIMPIEAFKYMPIKMYLTINNDLGIVNDPFFDANNSFNNRLLWGKGIGLDFVLFYDKVISLEYSFNHINEKGLFIHLNLNV